MGFIEFFKNMNQDETISLIIAIGIIAVFNLLSPLFSYEIIKLFNFKKNRREIRQNAFYIPLKSFFKVTGIYIAVMYFGTIIELNSDFMFWSTKIYKMVLIITSSIGLGHGINRNSKIVRKIREKSEKDVDDTTVIFAIRLFRFIIYIIAGFMIVFELGYDLSGLITGLGLGSVVITLAAQDTIKSLFGGMIIFLDKPFKVGDYIKFNTFEGSVEDITFRSTKLRTLENSIAQIPNSEISNATIINLSKIKKRRYEIDLGITLNTQLSKMMNLEDQILDFLSKEEHVIENSANVAFKEVRSSDYSIFVYCYLDVIEYANFLKIQEKLNYQIMKIIQNNGIELAYDTKTIEIKNT